MSEVTGAAGFPEIRAGNLGLRLAENAADRDAIQALRYRVFYGEMGAKADAETAASQRDKDAYDSIADHLMVVDHELGDGPDSVVGTYRLIRREAAARRLAAGARQPPRPVAGAATGPCGSSSHSAARVG